MTRPTLNAIRSVLRRIGAWFNAESDRLEKTGTFWTGPQGDDE